MIRTNNNDIISDDSKEVKHKWKHGEWKDYEKTDVCVNCGCTRHSSKDIGIHSYVRSGIHYERAPKCFDKEKI